MKKCFFLIMIWGITALTSFSVMARADSSLIEAETSDWFTITPVDTYYVPNAAAMVGCWEPYPIRGNGLSESLNFYEDGTFVKYFSGGLDPRVYQKGVWWFEDNWLTISISSQLIYEGGEVKSDWKGYGFVGGKETEQKIDPPVNFYYEWHDLLIHYDGNISSDQPQLYGVTPMLTMTYELQQLWKVWESPLPQNGDIDNAKPIVMDS